MAQSAGQSARDKTFFFLDGEQKYQRHGITFTGLVPSEAMRNGDYSADPFGNALGAIKTDSSGNPTSGIAIINPNMLGASTSVNVFPNIYFQCDPSGAPLPANATEARRKGTPCNKIPAGLINPIGQAMMNFYPNRTQITPRPELHFVNSPVRTLDETKFDIRVDQISPTRIRCSPALAMTRPLPYVPGGAPGFAEQSAFGSNQGIINHARNVAIGETHIFSPVTVNQFSFGYNRIFDYITSTGTGTCESAKLGIPGANLGCPNGSTTCIPGAYSCGLVSTLMLGWLLVPGRSRLHAIPRWNQYLYR